MTNGTGHLCDRGLPISAPADPAMRTHYKDSPQGMPAQATARWHIWTACAATLFILQHLLLERSHSPHPNPMHRWSPRALFSDLCSDVLDRTEAYIYVHVPSMCIKHICTHMPCIHAHCRSPSLHSVFMHVHMIRTCMDVQRTHARKYHTVHIEGLHM